jgi:hypothetical protein
LNTIATVFTIPYREIASQNTNTTNMAIWSLGCLSIEVFATFPKTPIATPAEKAVMPEDIPAEHSKLDLKFYMAMIYSIGDESARAKWKKMFTLFRYNY